MNVRGLAKQSHLAGRQYERSKRVKMRRSAVILPAIVLMMVAWAGALAGNPDIGGEPVHTEEDYFRGGEWGMTVYSYVFDNSSASLPGVLELDPGEMLFMYLLDVSKTSGTSVEHYAVGNPDLLVVNTVGFEDGVVPAGYEGAAFDEPYIYGYSGTAEAAIYTYYGDLTDPCCTLDPGEYSLVYYIAVTDRYGPVSATADSQGIGDNQLVPGPLCIVEFHHFARFAEHWLEVGSGLAGDLDGDLDVDWVDLGGFVDKWLCSCPYDWPLR